MFCHEFSPVAVVSLIWIFEIPTEVIHMKKLFRLLALTLVSISFLSTNVSGVAEPNNVDKTASEKTQNTKNSQNNGLAQATYILQVSSNLDCKNLDISLISDKSNTPQYLKFTSSAYAAIDLPQGNYSFGSATCSNEDGKQTFNILREKIMPLSLAAGKVYYGGRLIFKKVENADITRQPKVLENCTRVMSAGRGESSNECRDGVGVETSARTQYQINAFIPEVTDKDIGIVRSTLSMSEDQFRYLPIQYKKN